MITEGRKEGRKGLQLQRKIAKSLQYEVKKTKKRNHRSDDISIATVQAMVKKVFAMVGSLIKWFHTNCVGLCKASGKNRALTFVF